MSEPRDELRAVVLRLQARHREWKSWPSQRNDPRAGPDGYLHYCHPCGNVLWPCDVDVLLREYARLSAHQDNE